MRKCYYLPSIPWVCSGQKGYDIIAQTMSPRDSLKRKTSATDGSRLRASTMSRESGARLSRVASNKKFGYALCVDLGAGPTSLLSENIVTVEWLAQTVGGLFTPIGTHTRIHFTHIVHYFLCCQSVL